LSAAAAAELLATCETYCAVLCCVLGERKKKKKLEEPLQRLTRPIHAALCGHVIRNSIGIVID
jgi:hypothetical protein